ncbi:MAG: hypothetical protein ACRDVP_04705 [Acidimicrobiales bacterium]
MRVPRAVSFIDLSGFTALTQEQGDDRAVLMLSTFRTMVREVCSRRGVRIAKWLGDGAMLVGVECKPLIATVLELQLTANRSEPPIGVRCGMTADDIILFEGDDYIGHAVNVAARLCDLAPDGGVWAGQNIVGHLPAWSAVLAEEEIEVRGIEGPMHVWRLGFAKLAGEVLTDPVCSIPLTVDVAEESARDAFGSPVLFCSESCRETWEHGPKPPPEVQGSLRMPFFSS